MRDAEQVTFGGSGLNRGAEIRGDAGKLAEAAAHPKAACVLLWRGKPLMAGAERDRLAMVPMDHPVLKAGHARFIEEPLFLGFEESGAPDFVCDISGWEPEGQDLGSVGAFFDPSEQVHPDFPPEHVFAEIRRVMARLSPRDAELAATAKAVATWHSTHQFCARCGGESYPSQGGWQRTCKVCGAQHFPRTDPVVIMLILRGNSVLLGRSPGWPQGMYSLLAGFVEPGETIEAAVRREVFEESSIRVGQVDYLASQPWPFPCSLMIGCRGEAVSHEIAVDPVELEEAMWVTREDMLDVFAGQHPTIRPPRQGAIAGFLLKMWLADRLD